MESAQEKSMEAAGESEVIGNPYMRMWIEDGIVRCRYAQELNMTLEVAKICVEARLDFQKGRSYPVLVDMKGIRSSTREAREYLASVGTTLVKAGALITGSKFNTAIGNIFLTIDQPAIPTRMFTSEESAKQWLKSFLPAI